MSKTMMACGHAANATDEKGNPTCVICLCKEIATELPDLSSRKARCTYYGTTPRGRNHESNYDCKRGQPCLCERPSGNDLPFFKHQPDQPFDEFFCGCWGWD